MLLHIIHCSNAIAGIVIRFEFTQTNKRAVVLLHLNHFARAELARPVEDRLFFAGEATHECYMGDAHGAHLSGEAAAEAVLAALGR